MSGWTVVTVEPKEGMGPKLDRFLQDVWSDMSDRELYITWHDHAVEYPVRGAGYGGGAKDIAKEIFDECDVAKRVLVVCANDTSDSGDGWLFERTESGVVKVDEKDGYEGARGRDVTGYFREEHDINGLAHVS